jgi:Protein of unknown function (DUF3306)
LTACRFATSQCRPTPRHPKASRSRAADGVAPVAPIAAQDASVPIAAVPPVPAAAIETPLPPVESLTIDSDFTAFLQPKVDEALKRQALKKLFADPRFNVMDGLDVYIDDYTKSDPIPPDILERLMKHFDFSLPAVVDQPRESTAEAAGAQIVAPSPASEPPGVELPDASDRQPDSSSAKDPGDPTPPR